MLSFTWHVLGCTVHGTCYALLYLARARLYCTWHVRDCSVPGMFQGLFLHVIRWRVGQQLVQRDDIAGDLHTSTSVNRFLIINLMNRFFQIDLMEPAFPKRPDGIGFSKSSWWDRLFQIVLMDPAFSDSLKWNQFSKSTWWNRFLQIDLMELDFPNRPEGTSCFKSSWWNRFFQIDLLWIGTKVVDCPVQNMLEKSFI